jgi:hypothetical protein
MTDLTNLPTYELIAHAEKWLEQLEYSIGVHWPLRTVSGETAPGDVFRELVKRSQLFIPTPAAQPVKPIIDMDLLRNIWDARNPCHEINQDTGEDMFWNSLALVVKDYLSTVATFYHVVENRQ